MAVDPNEIGGWIAGCRNRDLLQYFGRLIGSRLHELEEAETGDQTEDPFRPSKSVLPDFVVLALRSAMANPDAALWLRQEFDRQAAT